MVSIVDTNEFVHEIPPSTWLAVGLLDGRWLGGKVMVSVNISTALPKIHLVHILAEQISKKNGYSLIDTCFAYCPSLDLFIPFASSISAANMVERIYNNYKIDIVKTAIALSNNLNR